MNPFDTRPEADGFVDRIAIEEALRWNRRIAAQLTDQELLHAVALGKTRGYSIPDIADRLGLSERHVERLRPAASLINVAPAIQLTTAA